MQQKIKNLLEEFNITGEIVNYDFFKNGHINTTVKVEVNVNGKRKQYVLQKINHNVFTKPYEVLENISNVTNHIKNEIHKKGEHSTRKVLKFYPAKDGRYCTVTEDGEYWRIYKFVDNSLTFNETDDLKILEETGKAFGEFQLFLDNFPIEKLNITIPHFHNTVNRYKLFMEAIQNDPVDRVKDVQDLICEYNMLENIATRMYKMQKNNELQLRVTHNDTKCNNVLFDKDTLEKLCVIDLDTVMPGLIGFDFGDAIRFGASNSAEDEVNVNRVKIDLDKYNAFAKGFLSKVAHKLTYNEQTTLSLGAITMTIECGLRFLTDYINGDTYFKTDYPTHNLVRARCQLALAQDMIKHYQQMQEIIEENLQIYSKQN